MGPSQTLYAWKFIVPSDKWHPDPEDSSREYKGMLCVVVATDLAGARIAAERYCAEHGHDVGWFKVAKVKQVPLIGGAVLAFAEV